MVTDLQVRKLMKLIATGANIAVVVCGIIGAVALAFKWGNGTANPLMRGLFGLVGAGIGAVAGFISTWIWRVMAQLVLCFAQIEENTRGSYRGGESESRSTLALPRY
jgi:hypothetical protein